MTRKLWQSGASKLDPVVEKFLAADDLQWDQRLVPYDILGNAAQARVLVKAKVLTKAEGTRLVRELARLYKVWERGGLRLRLSDEDVHTRIEAELTRRLGSLGKKIHTGRSRNDQVLVDIRLYLRDRVNELRLATLRLAETCERTGMRNEWTPLPGYTHMQRAMPSSIGLWMGAWYDSFYLDDLHLWNIGFDGEGCPLGTGSGFGSLVPSSRWYAQRLLDFDTVQWNSLFVQTGRGKAEMATLHALAQILLDCNRLATDCLLFSTTEFGFVRLPASMTTGSSLMPNKRNCDVWELIRAAYHVHLGDLAALASVQANLPSGYNRDLQVTKGILIRAVERALEVIEVTRRTVEAMQIDVKRCRVACDDSILATDRATLLALSGTPFRDAYQAVKKGAVTPDLTLEEALRRKQAEGAPGNLQLGTKMVHKTIREVQSDQRTNARTASRLLSPSWRMGR